MNKKQNQIIVIGIVLIILFLIGNQFGSFSIIHISGVDIEPETRSEIWNEIPIEITSVYFGSITSRSGKSICNDNDGQVSLSNSYNLGDLLDLSTIINVNGECDCGPNYIEVNMEVPEGTLRINCNAEATSDESGGSIASARVDGNYIVYASVSHNGALPRSVSDTDIFERTYTEPTNINIKLQSTASGGGRTSYGSSARCSLSFEEEIEIICTAGETKCEDTIYYTCENNDWVSQGEVDGYCGYITPINETECYSDSDCDSDEECRSGECVYVGSEPECYSDSDCADDEYCSSGVCIYEGNGNGDGGFDFGSIWEQYKIIIMVGGGLLFLLILVGGRRK